MASNLAAVGIPISNGLAPEKGPRSLKTLLDFSSSTTAHIDLTREQGQDQIDLVQAMFVDNLDITQTIDIGFYGTEQRIRIPASSWGYYPIMSTIPLKARCTTSAAGIIIPVIFINVPMAPIVVVP